MAILILDPISKPIFNQCLWLPTETDSPSSGHPGGASDCEQKTRVIDLDLRVRHNELLAEMEWCKWIKYDKRLFHIPETN